MSKKVLLTATVQSHICQFHKPLVKMLHDNGYEVYVAARDNLAEKNGLALDFVDKVYDIPFERSPLSLKNLQAYKELKKIISEEHFDVIHTNTPAGGIYTRLAARKARKKGTRVIYTAHGFHFYKGAPLLNWLIYYPIERFMSRFTDTLVTITQEDTELATSKFKCDVRHIHGVGANGTKYYVLPGDEIVHLKKEYGFSETAKIILNVGELLPNKNQKTAVLAMTKVKEKYPNAVLLIAGNGVEKENLEKLVSDNGLDENVKFLGYTLKLNHYANIADCSVACSFREGLPLNVMEAMLCGKAVVASDNRGHRELIIDGETGFLVPADNPDAFAEKICFVLSNPEAFREATVKRASFFTASNVYNELYDIYFFEADGGNYA